MTDEWYVGTKRRWHRPRREAAAGTFSGARMIGTVNSGGSGATVELPTNSGSVQFGADAVVAVSYDEGGFTTGHGTADGKFIVPAAGFYRITAHLGFQYFSPGDRTAIFQAWIAIDGDHGNPAIGDERRVWVWHRTPLRADSGTTELWTPVITMTEELAANELISVYGRFDASPSQVGDEGWGGFVSFEIASA